jgi:hypothetical protein
MAVEGNQLVKRRLYSLASYRGWKTLEFIVAQSMAVADSGRGDKGSKPRWPPVRMHLWEKSGIPGMYHRTRQRNSPLESSLSGHLLVDKYRRCGGVGS